MKRLIFGISMLIFSSCNLSDETRKVSGRWVFASEGKHDKVLDGGARFIPCEVIRYGYNDDFIIAAQKPTSKCFLGKDTNKYVLGKDSVYYWVVVHRDNLIAGPMTKNQFEVARDKFKIPVDLKLETID